MLCKYLRTRLIEVGALPGSQENTIMPAMPRSANSIAYLPFLLTRSDSNHCPDYLVARNNGTATHRESVCTKPEIVRGNDILWTSVNISLDHCVGVTNARREHLDKDLPLLGLLELNIFDGEFIVRFLEEGGLVGLWECRSHANGGFNCVDRR